MSASAFASPSRPASTVLAPLQSTSTGSSPRTNTSDFTICPTVQPIAAAASCAVRVPSGNSRAPSNAGGGHAAAVGTRDAISSSVSG